MVVGDEAHAAHVGRERVDLVDAAGGFEAVFPAAQVEEHEFVGLGRLVFRVLEIDAAHPVAAPLEVVDEVVADEAAGSGNENAGLSHRDLVSLGHHEI